MTDQNTSNIDSVKAWISEHKLRTVGSLWLAGLAGSFAYNWSQPNMKTSVKIIHARDEDIMFAVNYLPDTELLEYLTAERLHAQALTLAALSGAALVEYYEHKSGTKAKRYEKHM